MDKIRQLQDMINESNRIVFFGGAGVSTESNIPDFRSADGLYKQKYRYSPEQIVSHSFFMQHTEEFYDFYKEKMMFLDAKPNKAHLKLAELEAAGKLTAAVAAHQITKEYLAVLRGHPEKDSDTLTDLLFRDAAHNKSYVVQRMRKGVREATLDYTVLDKTDALTLVKVRLHTGRTHQIRVQFSHRGLPLLGDIRYGSKADCSAALWSYRLAFTHPVTGEAVDVTCPPPCEFPWDQFNIKKAE